MSQPMQSSFTDDLNLRIYADLQKGTHDIIKSGYDRTAETLAANERYELAEEARNQRNTQNIIDAISNASAYGITATERNGSANLTATEKNGSANLAATERIGGANLTATQRVGADLGMQAERLANENMLQFGSIRDRVTDYFYNTAKDFCHTNENIRENKYDLSKQVGESKYDLSKQAGDYFAKSQIDLIKVENSLGRQADNNFANVQKQLCDVTGRLELQAANNTAAIQIEALKTKGDLLQKMADCCCEIKEKVVSTGDSVKDLVKAYDTERLRDALRLAETRNIYYHHDHHRHHDRDHHRFPYPYPFPFPFPPSPTGPPGQQ
jgi:hypothetical protein